MDVREKLVDLIKDGIRKGLRARGDDRIDYSFEDVADHLISNGVTVQDFGSVNDMNNRDRCNFEHNHDTICGSTNLPCIKCNPGGCDYRKEGADNG